MQDHPSGEFAELANRFSEFRLTFARLASDRGEPACRMVATLDGWANHMRAAQEAAARAPETDRVLARAWGARLVNILQDARQLLAEPLQVAVSIDRHDTGIHLSRLPKPATQPVARPVGRRPSHPGRRRR